MTDSKHERIVHLDRLTSREVGEWMRHNDTIIVPHGPVSGHGAYTTLGMHPHGAEAIAVLLARKCNAVVFPRSTLVLRVRRGCTPARCHSSYDYHVQTLKHVARALYQQGFGRIFFLAFTNPEDMAGAVAARDLFDLEGELPVTALHATRGLNTPAIKQLIADSAWIWVRPSWTTRRCEC